jgi:hypothetical protein
MSQAKMPRGVAVALLALGLGMGMAGCAQSADSQLQSTAVYQRGATPTTPWATTDNGAASGGTDTAPSTNMNSGVRDAGASTGMAGMQGGSGGMNAGSGGMQAGSGGMQAKKDAGSAGSAPDAGATGSGGMTGTSDGPMPTGVTLDFTTLAQGGRYQPQNIGVVWVQNSSGALVTTLEVWAGIRAIYLSQWLSINFFGDRADAVSSATLRMHKSHQAMWNLKDSTGAFVPDGEYTLFIEVTDKDAPGANTSVKFTKGPKPQTVMPPDAQFFHDITLKYQ